MNRSLNYFLLVILLPLIVLQATAADFVIVDRNTKAAILYDPAESAIDSIVANLLADDINRITGYRPAVLTDITKASGNVIVIGSLHAAYIQQLLGKASAMYKNLAGKWECFGLHVMDKPAKNISKALIISGSDDRGTAYGVFTLTEKMGVSPWYWWADVPVMHRTDLSVSQPDFVSDPPSVKYRGIFINDEDWGLQPWAAKTFEPETGDIGPATYAKVFELLLRLKANLIWPAMHPGTKAFYSYPGNKAVAAAYSIVVGSSHAEPMLRNNVGEWDVKTMGAFNYITNKENVYRYWEERVRESSVNNAIYTMGMRGVHDSGIEGVKDAKEAVPLLHRIIADQRGMLEKYLHKKATDIPQVFTAYKEVLDIYDNGLQVPDDVTLVWPDDNYGYIQRLDNKTEQKRSGGSGIYYHASYWGRPHDYLWLSTTHPSLIREEMMKAYDMKSDRLWVLNVGDIKPLEYNIQLFLDMAYNAAPFKESRYSRKHLSDWVTQIFGKEKAATITGVLWNYYQLAFERRPEFMGWSQTEPTTQTHYTAYNHFYYGDEAQHRIDRYDSLQKQVTVLRNQIDSSHATSFYELVYYPVTGAALINKKFIYRDKAYLYAKQNRKSAFDYAALSKLVYDSIVQETDYFNNQLANGKWKYIMSMKPRDLPVYKAPDLPALSIDTTQGWNITAEGFMTNDSSNVYTSAQKMTLPQFNHHKDQQYFTDIFTSNNSVLHWTATPSADWIRISQETGTLGPASGNNQQRLWISVNWSKAPGKDSLQGSVMFAASGKQKVVYVQALNPPVAAPAGYNGFVENNGYLSIYAAHYTERVNKPSGGWKLLDGPGAAGAMLEALPLSFNNGTISTDPVTIQQSAPYVDYAFYIITPAPAEIAIYSLPTQPLNNQYSMRYALSIDQSPLKILDYKTVGRSEEWKQNVLGNSAIKSFQLPLLNKGKHTMRIYMVDPAVILDRITIDLGGLKKAYSAIAETR